MDDLELNPKQSGILQRFMLPLTIIGCVTVVLMLFVVGYLTLSTPDMPTEDIKTVIGKATADPNEDTSNDEAVEDGGAQQPTQLSDGQFDFDDIIVITVSPSSLRQQPCQREGHANSRNCDRDLRQYPHR